MNGAGGPILVTGSHRSGTTWVGRMLCVSGEAGYIHEPFNPNRRPSWSGNRIPYWFLYVTPDNESFYAPVLDEVLGFRYPVRRNLAELTRPGRVLRLAGDWGRALVSRAGRRRPLVKDPVALFSAGWLADRFDMNVVVMIRHPAAFVGSLKRLDWGFKFRGWLAQEALLRDRLGPYESAMRHCATHDVDIVEQGIVMWNAMHHVIAGYRATRPAWSFVRHEDLARAPSAGFAELYQRLGLRWDERVAAKVESHSGAGNPAEVARWRHVSVTRDSRASTSTWRQRLTPEEVERVREGVAGVAGLFYDEGDWV